MDGIKAENLIPAPKEEKNNSRRSRKSRAFHPVSSIEPPAKLEQARIPVPDGIELHGAGHMLGSTQLVGVSEPYGRMVYTGDFKLRDGLTVKGAPVLSCDTLIAECTYGDPALSFPQPQSVLEDMERWARQNKEAIQLWGGYSTGKAQELVKFINEYLGETPIVGGRAAKVCEAYKRNGVKLEWLRPESAEGQEAMRGPFLSVMPPHMLSPLLTGRLAAVHRRKVLSAMASGWALVRQLPASAAFALSDHADFGELLQYAHESGAKRVILAHGENEKTAGALRAAGLNAQSIESLEPRQMVLKIEE